MAQTGPPLPLLLVVLMSLDFSGNDCIESSAPCESSDGGAGDGKLALESSFTTVNSLTEVPNKTKKLIMTLINGKISLTGKLKRKENLKVFYNFV